MTAPPVLVPRWKIELMSWLHALAIGGLSALASALDTASDQVLSVKTVLHAVAIGALAKAVGMLITKVGP